MQSFSSFLGLPPDFLLAVVRVLLLTFGAAYLSMSAIHWVKRDKSTAEAMPSIWSRVVYSFHAAIFVVIGCVFLYELQGPNRHLVWMVPPSVAWPFISLHLRSPGGFFTAISKYVKRSASGFRVVFKFFGRLRIGIAPSDQDSAPGAPKPPNGGSSGSNTPSEDTTSPSDSSSN